MFAIPKSKLEYLKPFRDAREKRESEKGKYDIDWLGIQDRARMMNFTSKDKGTAYFSHMSGQGKLKDSHNEKSRYFQNKKSFRRDQGAEKSSKEIQ